jgi:cytochrome c
VRRRLVAWAALAALPLAAAACRPAFVDTAEVERGRVAIAEFGCIGCHRIPGVPGADGEVGPPLDGFAARRMIAGVLPNTRENLVRWLLEPQAIAPGTAMLDTGLDEDTARAVAAYLATLD